MQTAALEQTGKKGVLKLSGELTIQHAEELRTALIKAIISMDDLAIDCSGASRVDLSFLQLLCSAHRTFTRLNKRVALTECRPEVLQIAVKEAGFVRSRGCSLDRQNSCLWVTCLE